VRILLLAAMAAALSCRALAAEPNLPSPPPTDWMKQAELFGQVSQSRDDDAVIAWERAHQSALSSGFLFDLSRRLLARQPAEAMQWYVVALVRGRYDAGRCIDDTANRAVSRLSGLAEDVLRYGQTHRHDFGAAGLQALARPDLLAHTVPPDWICVQGLSGMGGRSAGTTAPATWTPLARRLHQDYLAQFQDMAGR
jgi:hypothetical protein